MLDSHHQVRARATGHQPGYGFLQLARRDLAGTAAAARILGEPEGTRTGHAVKLAPRPDTPSVALLGILCRSNGGRRPGAGSLGRGGVRVPGGPPGLQNRWTALRVVGGFDSRPPPHGPWDRPAPARTRNSM